MIKFGVREAIEMFEMLRDSACMIDHYTDYISHCQDPALRQILENQQRRMVDGYQQTVSVMQGHGLDLTNIPRPQTAVSLQHGGAAAGIGAHGAAGMAGIQGTAGMAGIQGATGVAGMHGAPGMAGTQGIAGMPGMPGIAGMPGMQGTAGMPGGTNIQFGMQAGQVQPQQQAAARTLNDRTIAQGALTFHKCGATRATSAALESAEPHLRNLAANSARNCMDMAYEIFRYMDQRGFYQMPEMPRNFVSHTQAAGAQVHPGVQQNFPAGAHGYPGVQQNIQAGAPGTIPGQH